MVAAALIISLVTGSTGLFFATINLGFTCYKALVDRHAAHSAKEKELATQYKVSFEYRPTYPPSIVYF